MTTTFEPGPFEAQWPVPPVLDLPPIGYTDGLDDDMFAIVDKVNDMNDPLLAVTVIGGTVDEDDSDLVYPSKKSEATLERVSNKVSQPKARETLEKTSSLAALRRTEFYSIFDKFTGWDSELRASDVADWSSKISFLASEWIPRKTHFERMTKVVLGAGRLVVFVKGTPSTVDALAELARTLQTGDDVGFHIVIVEPSKRVVESLEAAGIPRL